MDCMTVEIGHRKTSPYSGVLVFENPDTYSGTQNSARKLGYRLPTAVELVALSHENRKVKDLLSTYVWTADTGLTQDGRCIVDTKKGKIIQATEAQFLSTGLEQRIWCTPGKGPVFLGWQGYNWGLHAGIEEERHMGVVLVKSGFLRR